MKNYFVYGCTLDQEIAVFKEFDFELKFISVEEFKANKEATSEDRVVVYGDKEDIKAIFELSFIYGFTVGLVSRDSQGYLRDTFLLPKDKKEALSEALEFEAKSTDLLYFEEDIVLWGAVVGEAPPHGLKNQRYLQESSSSRFISFLKSLKNIYNLKKSKITITTNKEQKIETVASGVVILSHDNHSCASTLLNEFVSKSSGKVLSMILSPSSVVEYFAYLYKAIFGLNKTLPKAVGIVQSESIFIESKIPLKIQVDGEDIGQTPAKFTIHQNAIKLALSQKFWQKQTNSQTDEKEVIKLGELPQNSEEVEYEQSHIPFFTHASTSRYKELFSTLRDEAKSSGTFITLMLLSTILATVGLFLNSSSVIIGAMLLAPLMQPIVSFSMGLLRFDEGLLFSGFKTVFIGVVLVLVSSSLLAYWLPFVNITSEIQGRLHPTVLDLIVALISGVAAAYAKNNQKIVSSLAGVSIAVALVPPIATAGIGLGWGDTYIAYNAFLLFVTNFVGIVFAASLTFVLLGYTPINRAKSGLFISLVLVLFVSVPLYFSFAIMSKNLKSKEFLSNKAYIVNSKKISLKNIVIKHSNNNEFILRCDTLSTKSLSDNDNKILKKKILHDIENFLDGQKLVLESVSRIRSE